MVKKYPKVRERKGKYYYRYDIKDTSTGKRKQKETKGFATAKAAYQEGLRIEEELRKGIYIEEKNILVNEWIDQWLEMYAASGRIKSSTVEIRQYSLKPMRRMIGMMKLKDVTRLQYESILNELKKAGRAKETIISFHAASKLLFTKAIQLEIIQKNPVQNVEIPTFNKTVEELESETDVPRYMEKHELAKFLQTASQENDQQMYRIFYVLAHTGMRISELLALRPTDIDQINRQISITKTLYQNKKLKEFTIHPPKTKTSKRIIDVSQNVISILSKQESWRKEFKLSRMNDYRDGLDFVFVNQHTMPGYPVRRKAVGVYMKEILRKAELNSEFSPHSLRHTYTSLMAEAGVDLVAIQTLLGHANDNITRSVYLHVTKSRKKVAVEKFDKLIGEFL